VLCSGKLATLGAIFTSKVVIAFMAIGNKEKYPRGPTLFIASRFLIYKKQKERDNDKDNIMSAVTRLLKLRTFSLVK